MQVFFTFSLTDLISTLSSNFNDQQLASLWCDAACSIIYSPDLASFILSYGVSGMSEANCPTPGYTVTKSCMSGIIR